MAKTKENVDILKLLKTKSDEKKIIFGKDKVLKGLKAKQFKHVLIASNCPEAVKEEINYYAKIAQVAVTQLEQNNQEIGVFCKRNFFVSVLGILGE
ncbi:MAG TPA: ribosomal L7Ae/L30e/S12e/Gadd45 family protein [Candidatus Nanoarchaeia archaeon]|nr:ribosomal L7Ae/L30e/S12e/Gadd45 family protein [Candidatus Nanoarchaeia archaeon]